jgi:hypothetical protein
MNLASFFLLALVCALFAFDWITLRRARRALRVLWIEGAVFAAGAFFIAFPDAATRAAHAVGIGRGVDFILYPAVIWLVRESLLHRRQRWEDAERLTEAVRALAIAQAREVPDAPVAASRD